MPTLLYRTDIANTYVRREHGYGCGGHGKQGGVRGFSNGKRMYSKSNKIILTNGKLIEYHLYLLFPNNMLESFQPHDKDRLNLSR